MFTIFGFRTYISLFFLSISTSDLKTKSTNAVNLWKADSAGFFDTSPLVVNQQNFRIIPQITKFAISQLLLKTQRLQYDNHLIENQRMANYFKY